MTDKTFTNDEFDRLSLNDRRAQSHTLDSSKVKQKVVGDVSTLDTFTNKVEKTVTFAAGTTGKLATGTFTIATVTGVVEVTCIALCTTDVTSTTGTLAVGTAISPTALIAQTTATAIDANELWHDATPDASVELSTVLTKKIVSQNIIYTVGTADITGGVVKFLISWVPLSSDGNVVVA